MEDDEETFVSIGTPLEFIDEDEPIKKPQKELQAVGVGTKARPRFHGAFTGGFSAGYFNTVGSKDGFTPTSFTSSKDRKNEYSTQRPEDFMDEDDFAEHGIAPRKFQTSDSFLSEDRKRRRDQAVKSATMDTLLGSTTALADLIVPEKLTIGVKLLRKMGWKEGQGMGPRYDRKAKAGRSSKDSHKRVYGCSLPQDLSEDSNDEIPENVTFAPKDVNPIKIGAKDNVHGIGYRGLDPRKALPATHVNLFSAPAVTKTGKKGIRGTAFGVGALEEEDEDIYSQDHMSNYDMTMEFEEDVHMGWTAPGRGKKHAVPVGYVGNLLEGFTLSGKKLPPRKIFPPPHLPRDYKPVHVFEKEDTDLTVPSKTEQDAVSRGLTLGETPVFESVFDLIPQKGKERLNAVKSRAETSMNVQSLDTADNSSAVGSSREPAQAVASSTRTGREDSGSSQQPSFSSPAQSPIKPSYAGRGAAFSPFVKDPEKQSRYDQYISLVKDGNPDAYNEIAASHMTEWEKDREKEEFSKAAMFYKPMTSMMASRFTRAKYHDDDEKAKMPVQEGDKNDRKSAASMKMYGAMTRDSYEWHPDRVVCKRFNIPDPYPGSTLTGIPKVKRDKYSVFNFLNFPSHEPVEEDTSSQGGEMKALPAPEAKPESEKAEGVSFKINSKSQPKLTASIFSSLMEEKSKDTSSVDVRKEEENRPSMDLFEAIFGNTDSEEDKEEKDTEKENSNLSDDPRATQATQSHAMREVSSSSPHNMASNSSDKASDQRSEKIDRERIQKTCDRDKIGEREMTLAQPSTSIFSHLIQNKQKEDVNVLPGAPVPIETLEMRLSGETEDTDLFGPELPPVMKDLSGNKLKENKEGEAKMRLSTGRSEEGDRQRERKKDRHKDKYRDRKKEKYKDREYDEREKDRHKHKKNKHTKSKKSKHKKKQKKDKKSHKKDARSTDSSSDANSDGDSPVSNQELLQKLRSLSRTGKL